MSLPRSGSDQVTGNSVTIGTFPAGETVNIGSYFKSQALEVIGADAPKGRCLHRPALTSRRSD